MGPPGSVPRTDTFYLAFFLSLLGLFALPLGFVGPFVTKSISRSSLEAVWPVLCPAFTPLARLPLLVGPAIGPFRATYSSSRPNDRPPLLHCI